MKLWQRYRLLGTRFLILTSIYPFFSHAHSLKLCYCQQSSSQTPMWASSFPVRWRWTQHVTRPCMWSAQQNLKDPGKNIIHGKIEQESECCPSGWLWRVPASKFLIPGEFYWKSHQPFSHESFWNCISFQASHAVIKQVPECPQLTSIYGNHMVSICKKLQLKM